MDFNYKKYSLEQLETWMSDALVSSEATPQEIFDVIKGVVEEEYHYFKHHTGRCYELLALLNGNGGHITNKYEERLDSILEKKDKLTCDKDDPSEECKGAWTNFWEEHYYPEEYKGSTVSSVQYTEEELDSMCDAQKHKIVKWQLPVQVDGLTGDCFVEFPDDLLEAANLKEGDYVDWVDQGDGSYLLKKVNEHS